MSVVRLLGLCALALGFAVVASQSGSAQPGVKVPPQIKPGMPPGGIPGVQPGIPGKNPIPGPGIPPGKTPGVPPGTPPGGSPGTPGTPGGVPSGVPARPRDLGKWPKEINGKTLEDCVKEMRSNPDPAVRESAVRTLPLYGPLARDKGAENLIYAMTKDQDLNVKLAAMSVGPTVLLALNDLQRIDQPLAEGLAAFVKYLDHESSHVRYEAVLACGAVGPYMMKQQPTIIARLTLRAKEYGSWHLRKVAVGALASIGRGSPPSADGDRGQDPDRAVVTALLNVTRDDNCALVRRAAIEALIVVGPVASAQLPDWRRALDNLLRVGPEKDKVNLLWVRVLILRNDPNGPKGNEAHLNAVGDALKAEDPAMRMEGCRALGVLGEEGKNKLQGLLDLIRDVKQPNEVTATAIMAASTMKSQDAIIMPVLQNASLTHPNLDIQKVAREAMAAIQKK